jgi:hypothetical protein
MKKDSNSISRQSLEHTYKMKRPNLFQLDPNHRDAGRPKAMRPWWASPPRMGSRRDHQGSVDP